MYLFRRFKKIVSLVLIFSLIGANLALANVQAGNSEEGLLTLDASLDKPEGIGEEEGGRIVLNENEEDYSIHPESAVYSHGSAQSLIVNVSPNLEDLTEVKLNTRASSSMYY